MVTIALISKTLRLSSFDTVDCNRPPVDKTRYTGYYISCIPQSSFDEAKPFVLMPLVADEALAVQGEENGLQPMK